MPQYTLKDPATGRSITVSGDSPPTEQEAEELFANAGDAQPQTPRALGSRPAPSFIPELVAGSPEQMQAARARNLQGQLGLQEPVSPTGKVSVMDRLKASFAPTAEEQKAFYESEYGKGSFLPISAKTALVRVPDGKGGKHWVVDNPSGLDAGDVVALASNAPELVSSIAGGIAATPTVAGAGAKLAVTSGASAVVGNVVGAIQDAAYRFLTGTPVNLPEIAQRRGLKTAGEAVAGMAIPAALESGVNAVREARAASNYVNRFVKEGVEAEKRLKDAGVNRVSANDIGDAIRKFAQPQGNAAEAGDAIAGALTEADKALRQKSELLARKAAENLQNRSQAEIAAATAAPVTPVEAGRAAIGGAKKIISDAHDATERLFGDAMAEISADAQKRGVGKAFVNLENTEKAIAALRGNLLKDAEGNTADLYLPLLSTVDKIKAVTGTPQELMAVRQLRTMLGNKIGGQSDMFPGLDAGVAKKLYGALSKDIDDSIAKFSGSGADKLRAYNKAYKELLSPVENNGFLSKLVNGGFENPEDMVKALANGGSEDWKYAKQFVPPNTYNRLRRAVVDNLMGGATEDIAGQKVSNLPRLSQRLADMAPEVKNEIFGAPAAWQVIEKRGRELEYLARNKGLFTAAELPRMDELNNAVNIAQREGYDSANKYLSAAIRAADKRRENLAESLVSLTRNGSTKHVAADPAAFFNTVALSGKYPAKTVSDVIGKLDPTTREEVGKVAFQQLWENARDATKSVVSGTKGTYSLESMLKNVFGSKEQRETIKSVLGDERFGLIEDWSKYMMKLAVQEAGKPTGFRSLTGLISVVPYKNLFAARATAYALEQASGRAFIRNATPEAAQLFAESRMIMKNPKRTAANIAVLQKALSSPAYGDYMTMMDNLSPEQQDAVDEYLTGRTK